MTVAWLTGELEQACRSDDAWRALPVIYQLRNALDQGGMVFGMVLPSDGLAELAAALAPAVARAAARFEPIVARAFEDALAAPDPEAALGTLAREHASVSMSQSRRSDAAIWLSLLPLLDAPRRDLRWGIAVLLARSRAHVGLARIREAAACEADAEIRRHLLLAVAHHGIAALAPLCQSEPPALRRDAIDMLASFPLVAAQGLALVVTALDDPAPEVTELATARVGALLARATDAPALVALVAATLVQRVRTAVVGSAMRRAAIASLGASGQPVGLPWLAAIAQDAADADHHAARIALSALVVHARAVAGPDLDRLVACRAVLDAAAAAQLDVLVATRDRQAALAALPVYQPHGRGTKCLAELARVPWDDLPHAYLTGPPRPDDLLRALASPDAESADEAYDELIGSIWHQGTIYEATVHAVPFLVALTRARAKRLKDLATSVLVLVIGCALHAPAGDSIARRVLEAFSGARGDIATVLGDAREWDALIARADGLTEH